MNDEDILKRVFETPEKDVETFMEAMKPNDPNNSREERFHDPRIGGKPDQIKAPELSDQKSQLIRIQHGWHHEDYVWHICPWHHKKPWKVTLERVIYATAQVMNQTIPHNVEVKIWLPMRDWEIPEVTFKAIGLSHQWNVNDKAIGEMNLKLFEVLNTLV